MERVKEPIATYKQSGKTKKKSEKQLENENYRRQLKTLTEKINRMVKRFGADIYLHSHRNGKQDIYTSYKDLPEGVKNIVVSKRLSNSRI